MTGKGKILAAAGAVCAGCLWMWKGRTGNPACAPLEGQVYAHRGLHGPGAPENSREAFRRAAARGFGAELDVHLLADGGLAVMHDSALRRTTGDAGEIEDLTAAQLAEHTLLGSSETIPTLGEVLDIMGQGGGPLIVELKTRGNNGAALSEAVCRELDDWPGVWCIESFDPRVVRWLRQNRPDVVRGQLSCDFIRDRAGLSLPTAFALTHLMGNLVTRPDFVAYRFSDRRHLANRVCRALWHVKGASWTLHSKAELDQARAEGLWPIFEGFDPKTGAPLT